jgi:vacuolar-type H+-ATPase subunit I/STV1
MDNEEIKETEEAGDTSPDPEDLEAIKAQLEEEKQAKTAAESALSEKDERIASLESSLSEAKSRLDRDEAAAAELAQVKEANIQAVSKYLGVVRSANPTIPQDAIVGETIEEIDAALAKATTIAESVKASLEAQAKETKVPAGAPARTEISVEGLSPREKIAAGIQQKGGM